MVDVLCWNIAIQFQLNIHIGSVIVMLNQSNQYYCELQDIMKEWEERCD